MTMDVIMQPDLWDRSRRAEGIAIASDTDDFRPEFAEWLRENWPIYLHFERLALRAIRAGIKRYSADAICHVIRWRTALSEKHSEFKINDHYTSDLARLFEAFHPNHEGFFRMRIRRVA